MGKKALILGIGGQDGYYLTELLCRENYEVWGVLLPEDITERTLKDLSGKAQLLQGSICDRVFLARVLSEFRPAEIYNLAGISFIPLSWERPGLVGEVNGSAVGQLLELIRTNLPEARFFQAGSSEMFGHDPVQSPQNETTPFRPDNPYASAKVFAAHLVCNYRKHYGLFACTGILFNHESPRRPTQFVTRKVTQAAAAISVGLQHELVLGEIDAQRDWSYAGDAVRAMWLMLQQEAPGDFVIGSGRLRSLRECLDAAFSCVGLDWKKHVKISSELLRPKERRPLVADPGQANRVLGWKADVDLEHLIEMMMRSDLARLCGSPVKPA